MEPAAAHSIDAALLSVLLEHAVQRGQPRAPLLARFGLTEALLAEPFGRVPVATALRLWAELPELLGDPHFGLHVAEHAALRVGSLLLYLFETAATLGDALASTIEHQRLVQDVDSIAAERTAEGELRVVHKRLHLELTAPPPALEFAFALAVLLARQGTGVHVAPRSVAFTHPPAGGSAEYRRVFGCAVSFRAPESELRFDARVLELPLRRADKALHTLLTVQARGALEKMPDAQDLRARVLAVLRPTVAEGEASAERVARALGMHPRTLHRRLAAQGTTLQALWDELRFDRARLLLADGSLSLRAVALHLGFSDPAAFHRAFQRWSGGTTPGAFRKGLEGA